MTGTVTSPDMHAIESILEMSGGYVLDFIDRTFAESLAELGCRSMTLDTVSKGRRRASGSAISPEPLLLRRQGAFLDRSCNTASSPSPWDRGGRACGLHQGRRAAGRNRSVEPQEGSGPSRIAHDRSRASTACVSSRDLREAAGRARDECSARQPHGGSSSLHRGQGGPGCRVSLPKRARGMCLGFGCRHPERVNRAYAAQYNKPLKQFPEWKLKEWIDVLGGLGDLSPNIEKFGHSLRDFRNCVHPAEQLAHRFSLDQHTARIGFQVVVAATEDLVRAVEEESA